MIKTLKSKMPLKVKRMLHDIIEYFLIRPKYLKLTRESLANNYNKKRIILMTVPHYGNLGDHAITEAEVFFLEQNFSDTEIVEVTMKQYQLAKRNIEKNINKDDLILIQGGGFLGSLWLEGEHQVREIVKNFSENSIIIMPQTIFYEDDENAQNEFRITKHVYSNHPNLTIFLRERQSYEFIKKNYSKKINVGLVPDIVTYLDKKDTTIKREGILFCMRNDKEKIENNEALNTLHEKINESKIDFRVTDTVIDKHLEGKERIPYLEQKLHEFKQSELVITDRLHGMIFCFITGTPCIAFDNSSRKVSGVFEWIKDCGFIICINDENILLLKDFKNLKDELTRKSEELYSDTKILKLFSPLQERIKTLLNNNGDLKY